MASMTFITTATAVSAPANVNAVWGALITPAPVVGFGLAEFGTMLKNGLGIMILLF